MALFCALPLRWSFFALRSAASPSLGLVLLRGAVLCLGGGFSLAVGLLLLPPPLLRGELGGSTKWGRRRSARDRPVLAGWLVWTSDDLDCCCAAALFSLARASSSVGPRACPCVVRRCRSSATSPGAARRRDGQPSRPGPRRGESALVSRSKNRPRRLPRSASLLRRVRCCTWSVLRCRVQVAALPVASSSRVLVPEREVQ